MDAACSNSVCEDIDGGSNLLRLNCKQLNTEDQQYACTNMKDIVEKKIQEDCNYFSASQKDSLIDEVVRVPAKGDHLQDSRGQFSRIDATSREDDVTNSVEISTYVESGLSVSFDGSAEKCLNKSAAFPSELEHSHSFCVEENEAPPNTAASSQGVSIYPFPTYMGSLSSPAPSKLVSAMKGGRAQNGIGLSLGLRVKWALDVYDPPNSSLSRSLQSNNHQRSKSKKKDKHRHKHARGKTPRVSSSEKKHAKGSKLVVKM